MTGSSHPRFRLLIGWCCLMSAALLMMTVFLATRDSFKQQLTTDKEPRQTEPATPYNDHQKGFPSGQSLKNYIHLIRVDEFNWICNPPCKNSSLSLKNDTVEITISGLYSINAQVSFEKSNQANDQSKQEMKKLKTVTLLRNRVNGKQGRKLSEVTRSDSGSVSMYRMVHLMKGDSISLKINRQSMVLAMDDWNTYWEITLFSNQ